MDDTAVKVENLSKTFRLPHEKQSSVKGALINFKKHRTYETQKVLSDISFEINKGEFFGIVGRNGSGKSTLLKLLAGIYAPTTGDVHIRGSLIPFIELGVGFNQELTGRENVFLNGALLGFNRKEMEAMYKDIVKFAELEKFMDQKLKNYSSGMQVRLAFSIAIRARGDILLLDEVLAVGDAAFQKKCYDYFMELKEKKKSVILVTHDMGAVRQFCDKAIMIEAGEIIESGEPEEIAQAYQRMFIDERKGTTRDHKVGSRWGEGGIKIVEAKASVKEDYISLKTVFIGESKLNPPVYGFTVFSPQGVNLLESNTLKLQKKTEEMRSGKKVTLTWRFPNIFKSGRYKVSVACCDESTTHFYEWLNEATVFEVDKETHTSSITDPPVAITSTKIEDK